MKKYKYYDFFKKCLLDPSYEFQYLQHYPRTIEDCYNPNFLRDIVVSYASTYYSNLNKFANIKKQKNKC